MASSLKEKYSRCHNCGGIWNKGQVRFVCKICEKEGHQNRRYLGCVKCMDEKRLPNGFIQINVWELLEKIGGSQFCMKVSDEGRE